MLYVKCDMFDCRVEARLDPQSMGGSTNYLEEGVVGFVDGVHKTNLPLLPVPSSDAIIRYHHPVPSFDAIIYTE